MLKSSLQSDSIPVRSLLGYGLAKVLPGMVLFIAVPVWTRQFGNVEYGIFAACWAAGLLSSALTTGWLRQALLRYAGDSRRSLATLPRWVLPGAMVLSALPMYVTVLFMSQVPDNERMVLLVGSTIFAATNTLYSVVQANAQRENRTVRFTLAESVRAVGALLLSLSLSAFFSMPGAVSIVWAYAFGTLLGIIILGRGDSDSRLQAKSVESLVSFWNFGWPMTIWLACSTALSYIDRILIGVLADGEIAGAYSAFADMILRGFSMLAFPLTMVAHPAVMRMWNLGDKAGALKTNATYNRYLLILSAVLVFGACVIGTPVLEAILGVESPHPLLIPMLSLGAAMWQIALLSHKPMEMANRTRSMALVLGVTVLLTTALNILLIPLWGVIVPAACFTGGAALYLAVTHLIGRRIVNLIQGEKA